MSHVLIATLGVEPQVVTISAHLLLTRSIPLTLVNVYYTSAVLPSLAVLQAHFDGHTDLPPLEPVQAPVDDVLTSSEIRQYGDALFRLIKSHVLAGSTIHLLLAGGRKPMAMVGMSVAQFLLGPDDRVWYLTSDEHLRRSERMSPGPDDKATLVRVPVGSTGAAPPHYTRPVLAESMQEARAILRHQDEQIRRRFVDEELTPAEREVARLIATDVMTVQEMADVLHKSPKTVTNQLTTIYHKLETSFGIQPDKGVKREFLRRELGSYLKYRG